MGPAGHVVERVLGGVQTVGGGHDERDALGLHLDHAPAGERLPSLGGMEQDMTGLVSERLDRGRVVDVDTNPHLAGVEHGDAVRVAAVTP